MASGELQHCGGVFPRGLLIRASCSAPFLQILCLDVRHPGGGDCIDDAIAWLPHAPFRCSRLAIDLRDVEPELPNLEVDAREPTAKTLGRFGPDDLHQVGVHKPAGRRVETLQKVNQHVDVAIHPAAKLLLGRTLRLDNGYFRAGVLRQLAEDQHCIRGIFDLDVDALEGEFHVAHVQKYIRVQSSARAADSVLARVKALDAVQRKDRYKSIG